MTSILRALAPGSAVGIVESVAYMHLILRWWHQLKAYLIEACKTGNHPTRPEAVCVCKTQHNQQEEWPEPLHGRNLPFL